MRGSVPDGVCPQSRLLPVSCGGTCHLFNPICERTSEPEGREASPQCLILHSTSSFLSESRTLSNAGLSKGLSHQPPSVTLRIRQDHQKKFTKKVKPCRL